MIGFGVDIKGLIFRFSVWPIFSSVKVEGDVKEVGLDEVFVYICPHWCITVLPNNPVLPLHVVSDARLPVRCAASLLVASV